MTFIEAMDKKHGLVITPKMEKELEGFDPKVRYGGKADNLKMGPIKHRLLLGKASNLIRDMLEALASDRELVKAIKYGSVVLDAAKYGLDYKQAEQDFGIKALYETYHKRRV